LGFRFVSPISISSVFHGFIGLGMGRKNMLRWLLIWHSTIWAIWNSQNEVIFVRRTVSVESLMDKVKLSTWKWYLALKTLITYVPSISGRCNQFCVGADSAVSDWPKNYGAMCIFLQHI
jgi:hypothetical protein